MSEIDVFIAGRAYKVACRDGEEDALRKAAALVDTKSREALAGLGTLSEARQLLFASLLRDEFKMLRPGAFVFSVTSSDDEIDLSWVRDYYEVE